MISKPIPHDPYEVDHLLEKAVVRGEFEKFTVLLDYGGHTLHGLNRCLAFSAAAQGLGNFSEALIEAGADMRVYLNGRLDRAAAKGSVEKINRWRNAGADIYHNDHQPLRAALFSMQKKTTVHLLQLGCSFDRALTNRHMQNAVALLDNGQDVLKFVMRMKTGFIAKTLDI